MELNPARLLRECAGALYGGAIVHGLSRDLQVNQRTVYRWLAGSLEVPPAVWQAIAEHLQERHAKHGELIARINSLNGE
jgi:hypothetical protein